MTESGLGRRRGTWKDGGLADRSVSVHSVSSVSSSASAVRCLVKQCVGRKMECCVCECEVRGCDMLEECECVSRV